MEVTTYPLFDHPLDTLALATKMAEVAEQQRLDLGTVHVLAEVAVNGKTAGIAWKPPYRVDITDAVKAGANTVSIKVVNLWPNRLIGDMQPWAAKVAFAPNSTYTANSPLMPSGLMGPVAVDLLTEIQ